MPQLSRTLGNLNEITALVLSETFAVLASVSCVELHVELSSPYKFEKKTKRLV